MQRCLTQSQSRDPGRCSEPSSDEQQYTGNHSSSGFWWLSSNNITGCNWEPGICQCGRSPQHRDCPSVPEPSEPLSAHQQPGQLGLCRRGELWACGQPSRQLHVHRVHAELAVHGGFCQRGGFHHHHRLQGTMSGAGLAAGRAETEDAIGCLLPWSKGDQERRQSTCREEGWRRDNVCLIL